MLEISILPGPQHLLHWRSIIAVVTRHDDYCKSQEFEEWRLCVCVCGGMKKEFMADSGSQQLTQLAAINRRVKQPTDISSNNCSWNHQRLPQTTLKMVAASWNFFRHQHQWGRERKPHNSRLVKPPQTSIQMQAIQLFVCECVCVWNNSMLSVWMCSELALNKIEDLF